MVNPNHQPSTSSSLTRLSLQPKSKVNTLASCYELDVQGRQTSRMKDPKTMNESEFISWLLESEGILDTKHPLMSVLYSQLGKLGSSLAKNPETRAKVAGFLSKVRDNWRGDLNVH